MSQPHGNGSTPTATGRAEQALDTVGYRIGFLAGATTRRLERVVSTARAPSRSHTPEERQNAQRERLAPLPSEETTRQAISRAEDLVHRAEQGLGHWSTLLSYQSQRLAARMREDLEDIWAEAQHLRNMKKRS